MTLLGVTLSVEATSYTLSEGATATVCISASGSIPDSYSIDFSVMSYDITAESTEGKMDAVDGEWMKLVVWAKMDIYMLLFQSSPCLIHVIKPIFNFSVSITPFVIGISYEGFLFKRTYFQR